MEIEEEGGKGFGSGQGGKKGYPYSSGLKMSDVIRSGGMLNLGASKKGRSGSRDRRVSESTGNLSRSGKRGVFEVARSTGGHSRSGGLGGKRVHPIGRTAGGKSFQAMDAVTKINSEEPPSNDLVRCHFCNKLFNKKEMR